MNAEKPNVLFILSDQHNAKVTGYAGHPQVKTPNLDKLAGAGVRFNRAITQNPICTPSRMCWLSGQYCHNHGYYGLSGPNPDGLPTVLGHFRRHGYRTSAIGKIHCPEYWVEDDADVFHETCDCSIGGRSKKYQDFLWERGKLELEDHIGLPDFGGIRKPGCQSMEGCPAKLTFAESQEGWITTETIAFMRSAREAGVPFFAHASLPRPHQCTAPSEPFWSMYEGMDLALPPNADYEMLDKAPNLVQAAAGWRKGDWALIKPKTFEAARLRKLRGYLGAVSQVDHAVGQMLAELDELGLADNTVVIYSSDHGDYACEHGIMEKAPGICSDAITRIPMLWRWNGHFQDGHACEEIVETVDLAPTLCSLCGLPPLETADGADLSGLLNGGRLLVHEIGVTEFAWSRSVRRGNFRLVFYPKAMFAAEYPAGFGELYDLEADPWEMRNLYFLPEYQKLVQEMSRELTDWLITTTRPVTALQKTGLELAQSRTRYGHTVNPDGKIPWQHLYELAGSNYL